jgi:hypothetical protein
VAVLNQATSAGSQVNAVIRKPLSGFLMRTVISVIDLQSDLERERAKCGRAPIAGVPADREEGTTGSSGTKP